MRRTALSDETGAVAVVVAILMTVLLMFGALAVDVGYLYDTRHQLQAAADAAALAGCQRLIETDGNTGEAAAVARDYASRNANGAAKNLAVEAVDVNAGAEPWSVRVVVRQQDQSLLAGIFGVTSTMVRASSKAQRGMLSGSRYLVPWAVPIMRDEDIDRVEAEVVDGKGKVIGGVGTLSPTSDGLYEGYVTAPAATGGYDVRVSIINVFGIVEYVGDSKGWQPAARINVYPPNSPITGITMNRDYVASDGNTYPVIAVTTKSGSPAPKIKINNTTSTMSGSGTSWTHTVSPGEVPFNDEFLNTFPVDIIVPGGGPDWIDGYVHVRRSTYPVSDCWVESSAGTGGRSVKVSMRLNTFDPVEFVPGQIYTLRVASGGVETGNFGELNFKKITHTGSCPPDPAGLDYGNTYRDWLTNGYAGGVHVGDVITLSPGKSGSGTPSALADREAKYGELIVAVPVVTKYEEKSGGAYDVIVRNLAAFRVTEYGSAGGAKGTVRGEFIEYIGTSSSYFPPNTGSGTVYAAYLVNP